MRKLLLFVLVLFIGFLTVYANPLGNIRGLVSYSETISLYFDNEQNALRWIETQTDFMSQREMAEGERRLTEIMITSMIPDFQSLVRLHSEFLVMIERSPITGESMLMFFIRGRLMRGWIY